MKTAESTSAVSPLRIQVVGARPGTTIEIVPGKTFFSLPPDSVDTIAVTELVPAGDGTFRPVARVCPRWWMLNAKNLKALNIAISDQSLARLVRAKFVRGQPITPRGIEFDYLDYLRHQAAVAADAEEFWDKKEPGQLLTNIERYRAAI